jgi:glycerol-3-phosphate acyltransferase PlsX
LAHLYLKTVRKIEHPSIALLSNGTEAYKGTALLKEAYELLQADPDLNFVGYTEGHTMLDGQLDIMVCDGFIGNVLLKFAEGAADIIMHTIREELKKSLPAALAAKTLQRSAWQAVRKRLDYAQYGGAPLLGLDGNVVICHGRSTAEAIKNALGVAYRLAVSDINREVAQYVQSHSHLSAQRRGINGNVPAVPAE